MSGGVGGDRIVHIAAGVWTLNSRTQLLHTRPLDSADSRLMARYRIY